MLGTLTLYIYASRSLVSWGSLGYFLGVIFAEYKTNEQCCASSIGSPLNLEEKPIRRPGRAEVGQMEADTKPIPLKTQVKAAVLLGQTTSLKAKLNIPTDEQVVQTYLTPVGKVWVTENLVCFTSKICPSFSISFRNITSLALNAAGRVKVFYLSSSGLAEQTSFIFSLNPKEPYHLLSYLFENPLQQDIPGPFFSIPNASQPLSSSADQPSSPSADFEPPCELAVDLEGSKRILRDILKAKEHCVEMLAMLYEQGKSLEEYKDRLSGPIAQGVARGHELLNGLESFGGGLALLFTSKSKSVEMTKPPFRSFKSSFSSLPTVPNISKYPVLLKLPDTSLHPATLQMDRTSLQIEPRDSSVFGTSCGYLSIESVVLRSRPLHIDIRLASGLPRIRLVSTSWREILTELFVRPMVWSRHLPDIVFEPNVPVFDYGSLDIYRLRNSVSSSNQSSSSILGSGVPQKIRQDYDEAMRNIEEAVHVLNELFQICSVLSAEMKFSEEEINTLKDSLSHSFSCVKALKRRVDRSKLI
ncbi:MAG: hypothetical protein Q8P67_08170 [archaeon]|nr:hypothetical protein [archaeon]